VSRLRILLKNADVITVNDNHDLLKKSCVGISGTSIDYVGDYSADLEENYNTVINCRGKIVMPGFVNAHNHSPMSILRNYADDLKLMDWLFNKVFPIEDRLTSEAVHAAANLAILEMLKSGTTCFSDMYFFMDMVAQAVDNSGMRAVLSRGLQGESGEEELDYRLSDNIEFYKSYHNAFSGRVKVMFGPHSVYTCSLPYLKKVAAKSAQMNISVQIHLSETRDEVKNCVEKYGVSPIKLADSAGLLNERTLAAHCVFIDDEDIEILRKRKVNVVHNPGSNMKLGSGVAPIAKLLEKGINVALGTDGASSNNNLDMLEEMRMATYLQKVITEDPTALPVDQVIKMATVNGARALEIHNLGKIETGMKADIIIIDTEKAHYYPKHNVKSSLIYSGNSADVETVIIDGRIIMKDREVLTMDEERILYDIQAWAEKLTK